MTREQVTQILSEGGVDTANTKLVVSALLNAFNEEKKQVVDETTNKLKDEYKEWGSPSDIQKLRDEISGLKDKDAKIGRIAKYKELGFNTDDADIVELLDAKFKNSDKDDELKEYAKAHPSFLAHKEEAKMDKVEKDKEPVKQDAPVDEAPKKEVKPLGKVESNPVPKVQGEMSWKEAVASHYSSNK